LLAFSVQTGERGSGVSGNLPVPQAAKLIGASSVSWYTKKGSF
jgi:hypothetical protein